MEDSQEKDYSFLGNDTFPNLYDTVVYEREFKSEYFERQIYKSEPSIELYLLALQGFNLLKRAHNKFP